MGLSSEQSIVARCGPQNASYKAYAACLDAHCPSECPADAAHHALLGKPAPELVAVPVLAPELPSEGPKSLAEARGKVVIVEFWATFCGICKWSFPRYQEIVDRYHGDVAMLAVSGDDPDIVEVGKLVDFARDTHVHFPILWDRTGETQKRYGQRAAFPKSFVIDRMGVVRFVHAGYGPADAAHLLAEVEALLAEPAPKTPSGDAAPSSGRSTP
jgi:thiol-disulfide isomerase/thioredoxin